jgi:hypothetical protein
MKTEMGIVVVADLAANAAAEPPAVAITATCRRTSSAASAGQSIGLIFGPAVFNRHILTFEVALREVHGVLLGSLAARARYAAG